MRAIIVRALGGPDVLTLGSAEIPRPGPGEVLVRLQAIGVNFSDTERRRRIPGESRRTGGRRSLT